MTLRISSQPRPEGGTDDVIEIRGLEADCIIGVYPRERLSRQLLRVDVGLHFDARSAAGGALTSSLDYARIAGEIRFILESAHFTLLESAADALARYLLAPPTADVPRAAARALDLRIEKPGALGGRGVPAIQITRRAEEMRYIVEDKPFGHVDIVYENAECGIYRLRIGPGLAIPTHIHRHMVERELVLGEHLLLQGRPVAAGTALAWPHAFPHRYDNPHSLEQTVLCIDRPPFLPHDEIEVPTPPEGLEPRAGVAYYPEQG